MSSVRHLREFIGERLTAAADEIFFEFEKTVFRYEEELARQRGLLEMRWKPHVKLDRTELPQHFLLKEEEVSTPQPVSSHVSSSRLHQAEPSERKEDQAEPECHRMKEEQKDACISRTEHQLVLKLEVDSFIVTPSGEEKHRRDQELNRDEVPFQNTDERSGIQTTSDGSSTHIIASEIAKKSFACDICGKGFEYRSKLIRHFKVHTGGTPYSCNTCEQKFSSTSALNAHVGSCTGEKLYTCTTCGTSFSAFRKFYDHMITHTGKGLRSCSICGKSFAWSRDLTKHMTTHTSLHACKICGKSFRHGSTLTTHVRTHTGEKIYSCETCGKCFTRKAYLTAHIRTHTGEKPFSCDRCHKKFSRRTILTVHMRTHTGEKPYSCELCAKCFRHKSTLTLHMHSHTG